MAVTLITGDTVYWQDFGDGNARVAEIEQALRDYPVTFDQSGTQEDFYVIPTDAMQHVVAGTVDMELFNIPGLIRQGLADATTDELPVIVTFDHDRSAQQLARDADALPATSNAIVVDKMNGAGLKVNRDKAGAFRQAVLGVPGRGGSTRTTNAPELDGAVEQVLLDRVLKIDLADSVPQIGAPHAWDAGYTGEGVTVAVLDTGIDTNHPDLAGQVAAVANFTDEPDATDTHGHGTHVASTIAGTGAASGGTRAGVAPGADLLIGKVCFPNAEGDGVCPTSAIMAGMEWAAEQGADVVNMSLGGGPTDGTDPLSQLINDLSVETDTLFVTSAGNSGCQLRVVGAPAAADAALAVGAVTKTDQLASFTSCGPRVGDHAVKPEITAPGVGIIAARAHGTDLGSPVDDNYTALNGTSMASPHVAGAAALLAQSRPDLDWRGLKDTLVSTAADGGFLWLQQGTGRVDVPAALESPVYAPGTVNLGGIKGQAEQRLTYTNHSNDDITLALHAAVTDLNGRPTDHASLFLQTDTLTVPARGSATITAVVALDSDNLTGQESFGGVVTATGPGVALRTAVGFGPPLHRVTIEVLDSTGNRVGTDTAPDLALWLTLDTFEWGSGGTASYRLFTDEGIATGHLPTGTYTALINVLEVAPHTGEWLRASVLTKVEFDVSANLSFTLDARDAAPIQVTVPRKVDKRNHGVALVREFAGSGGRVFTLRAGGSTLPMHVTPTPAGDLAPLSLYVNWILAEPQSVRHLPWLSPDDCQLQAHNCYSDTPGYLYSLPFPYENGIPNDLHERVARADLVEIPRQYHSDHPDAFVMHQFDSPPSFSCTCGGGVTHRIWFRPGKVREYVLADDRITWSPAGASLIRRPDGEPQSGIGMFSSDMFPTAEAGARRDEEHWFQAPMRMGAVDVREEFFSNPSESERVAVTSRGGVDGNVFEPGIQVLGNNRGHFGTLPAGASWRMWKLDTGAELEPVALGRRFELSPLPATYQLQQIEHYPANTAPVFLTGPATTTWTFASRPSDASVPDGYRCPVGQTSVCQIQPLIQLEYDLGLDIHNRVRAGRAHVFTITAGQHSKAIDRAPVTSMTVRASFDDGITWRDARVVGKPRDTWDTGGFLPSAAPYQRFMVLLRIPKLGDTNGFVALRVQAEDANGGTVDQLIHRAYVLK